MVTTELRNRDGTFSMEWMSLWLLFMLTRDEKCKLFLCKKGNPVLNMILMQINR